MIAPALALALAWIVATTVGPTSNTEVNDLFVYRTYAALLGSGALPYADFAFEYPPGALVPIAAGGAAGTDERAYAVVFGAVMLAAALAAQRGVGVLAGIRGAWAFAALPVVAGALVRTHFDLLPAALALAGLWSLATRRAGLAGALLGAGAATKLFPALLVPLGAAWLLAQGARRAAVRHVACAAAVALALYAPWVALAPAGLADSVSFHLERPLQIESTPASVVWALGGAHVTGHPVRPDPYKSNGLAGGPAGAVAAAFAALQALALAAALALAWRAARRSPGDPAPLALGALALLLAAVALGKVLSPQFVLWLAPLAVVAWASGARMAAALTGAAVALTQAWFPGRYFDLVAGDPPVVATVAARNALLLLALLSVGARLAARARWTPPAGARP